MQKRVGVGLADLLVKLFLGFLLFEANYLVKVSYTCVYIYIHTHSRMLAHILSGCTYGDDKNNFCS